MRAARASGGHRAQPAYPHNLANTTMAGVDVDRLLGTIIPLVPIFAPYLALVLLFFNRVIPAILMLLATAFMSPVVIARPAVHRLRPVR